MPWKIFSEDGKSKVYKVDEQGNKIGKPVGTHADEAGAKAQMRALYASEKKPKKEVEPGSDTITATVTNSDTAEETVKEVHVKMGYYDEPMMVMPMGGPLTFADLMAEEAAKEAQVEMYELTDQFGRLSRNIMVSDTEDKAGALVALAGEYAKLVGEKVKAEIQEEIEGKAIAKQIAGDNQPEPASKSQSDPSINDDAPGGDSETKDTRNLFIWKEGSTYRWLAAYSNNRRDNDIPPEIISSESHKEFDEALHKGEWPMPEVWLWHVPYPVGVTDYHAYDESAGFPVAAGHFYKGMEWAAEGILQAGWDGNSHGMPSEWIQRDKDDQTIITRHRTKEITFLPQWAAANKLAFNIISKETIMADEKGLPAHKREEFIKAFGEERVTQIETALADKAKEADDAGIEKKETVIPEALTPDNPVVKALEMVVAQLTALDTRLKAIEDRQVEVKEEPFDLMEFLKSKSVIGQPTAKLDGRSTLAKDAPKETEPASLSQNGTGMRVALVDQLVQANQAWYQEKN